MVCESHSPSKHGLEFSREEELWMKSWDGSGAGPRRVSEGSGVRVIQSRRFWFWFGYEVEELYYHTTGTSSRSVRIERARRCGRKILRLSQ